MNRLLLIASLLIETSAIAQSEVGTIKIRKEGYREFMRETPTPSRRYCLLPSPCIRNYVIVGAGFNPQFFAELGVERELFQHKGSAGVLLQIAKKEGAKLRVFGEAKVIKLANRPFVSLGLSADFALSKAENHAIQPYIGWRIPFGRIQRFQFNTGYSIALGPKTENTGRNKTLILGLWCRL